MGINKDAHLVGQDYSWLGTILYMGVLFGEYPTNLLLQKLPVAKYLAFNVGYIKTPKSLPIVSVSWELTPS